MTPFQKHRCKYRPDYDYAEEYTTIGGDHDGGKGAARLKHSRDVEIENAVMGRHQV